MRVTKRLPVTDVGNNVCTTRQFKVCNQGVSTFDGNGDLKYAKGQCHKLGKVIELGRIRKNVHW